MAKLIECPACGKKISDEIEYCMNCYQVINPKDDPNEIRIGYVYNGELLNRPVYRDRIEKVEHLRIADTVELFDTEYEIEKIIFSGHNNIVKVILKNKQ